MELVIHDKPVDRVRAFIRDYAQQLYGIQNANALMPLVEVAFNQNEGSTNRIRAASELAKYSEIPTRSIEYDGGKNGPDLEVVILGTCAIEAPTYGPADTNPEPMETEASSGALVELPDDGWEEGS